ncbi:MAG: radical SAM protein [Candidatus Nezhaarchaeales archaeon]
MSLKPVFFPRLVFWYAIEKCDLRCEHCYYPPSGGKELNTREAKLLIDSLARVGVKALAFIGGEPILRGDVFELCSYCVEKGLIPHFITKGKSLTRKDCERFSRIGVWRTIGVDTFTHRTAGSICGIEEPTRLST